MTDTPAPKSSRPRKAAAASTNVVELNPKIAKSTKSTNEPKSPPIADVDAAQLRKLHSTAVGATGAFEAAVAQLLDAGVSPTHVGKTIGLGNSTIRRIGWRRAKATS